MSVTAPDVEIRPPKATNAMLSMLADMRVIGKPLNGFGTASKSIFSRTPARSIIAMRKPTPLNVPLRNAWQQTYAACNAVSVDIEYRNAENRTVCCDKRKIYAECAVKRRHILFEHHFDELHECRDNENKRNGLQILHAERNECFCTHQVMTLATPITKVTASPIPRAVSVFLETPRKGQMPRN